MSDNVTTTGDLFAPQAVCPLCERGFVHIVTRDGQSCYLGADGLHYVLLSTQACVELRRKAEAWDAHEARLLVDTEVRYAADPTFDTTGID